MDVWASSEFRLAGTRGQRGRQDPGQGWSEPALCRGSGGRACPGESERGPRGCLHGEWSGEYQGGWSGGPRWPAACRAGGREGEWGRDRLAIANAGASRLPPGLCLHHRPALHPARLQHLLPLRGRAAGSSAPQQLGVGSPKSLSAFAMWMTHRGSAGTPRGWTDQLLRLSERVAFWHLC